MRVFSPKSHVRRQLEPVMKLHKTSPSQLISIISVTFFIVFSTSCTNSPEGKNMVEEPTTPALSEVEETNLDSYMIYKLYKERSKGLRDQPVGLDLFEEFNKIYEANDVKVVGVWQNIEDPNEVYFMTAFRSEEHYQNFVATVKQDSTYLNMSAKIEEDRESIEVTTLTKVN